MKKFFPSLPFLLALLVFFVSCKHEPSTSKLPEFKILLNSQTKTSTGTGTGVGTGTGIGSSSSCVVGSGAVGNCKL